VEQIRGRGLARVAIIQWSQNLNAAAQENDMVIDVAHETTRELALVAAADDGPAVLNPREETATARECEYCGHYPCGCGG
jgi:hypothetical protein